MKQEDKIELLEWAKIKYKQLVDTIIINERSPNTTDWTYDHWNPESDLNQLELLEEKMIEELEIRFCSWEKRGHKDYFIEYCLDVTMYEIGGMSLVTGIGKTKTEARLNAILSHVKKVKV